MAYFTHEVFPDGNLFRCRITVYDITFRQRLRFFLRRSSTDTLERDDVLTASGNPFEHTFYDLTSNTAYAVNVGLVLNGHIDLVETYLGLQTFTTGGGIDPGPGPGPSNPRPADWNWWSAVYSGGLIQISANEWNAFCARINAFRAYRGLAVYDFTPAYTGTPIYAYMANQARDAIWNMNYYVPDRVSSGDSIAASFFLGLQRALNDIN